MKKGNRKRNMQILTVMMFIITFMIWLALLFVKAFVWGLSFKDLVEDVISNILGIIPPMLIFDFVYEYLTKDHISDEISEQITKTLIGNSEAIEAFKDEDKIKFVKNTVKHIVGEESSEMVNAVIEPYITRSYNIKKFFKYTITLRSYPSGTMFDEVKYLKVYEDLKYKKSFIEGDDLADEVSIAFILKNHLLDSALRNRKYIFQENLVINDEEMDKLVAMSDDEKISFVKDEMNLTLYIDDCICEIKEINFSKDAIVISYKSEYKADLESHSVEISFAMPQAKGHSEILVSISEPTYSPIIQLSYPEATMSVKAFSFLNDGKDSSIEQATHNVGNYEFCIQDKWIYPMSGVVFIIDDI